MASERREEIVRRAGFVSLGDSSSPTLGVGEAISLVASVNALPVEAVPSSLPGLEAEIDRRWRILADRYRIIDSQSEMLLYVAGCGASELDWLRVRCGDSMSLARHFTISGAPEFMTLAVDGHALVAVTTEGDEIWLFVHSVE